MTNQEFGSISEIIKAFPDEQSCIAHLEQLRWEHYVISPFDASSKVYRCPKNTYKCKNTGKYFNVKTATIFHNSKIALQKWFIAIWLIGENKKEMTSVALGKELGITQKTAWYIIKRIKSYYHPEKGMFLSEKKPSKSKHKPIEKKEVKQQKLELLDWLALYQIKK